MSSIPKCNLSYTRIEGMNEFLISRDRWDVGTTLGTRTLCLKKQTELEMRSWARTSRANFSLDLTL